ncbi:TetR/AcrR family transcriptional regulator [Oscillibacter sp. MSJ-2]|uniref:TetR/AcrR family transcriptional regulator n=1 Tax=Dysosmobacter acutus TaxID=2841504 RepID=A0ABS6FBX3_9FIRM|nr:TetR/AcrR family transcriptional regulator [Dysosmobacter acutus]MBU5627784.1 TetR/AcrR family transcriptional regulator [Dysosmobacter acutus]
MSQITRRAIIQSFLKLLNQSPLDKITVRDIVDDCGVTRSTFYYYFEDIYALLEEVFRQETDKRLNSGKAYTSWEEGFLDTVSFALENRRAIFHVYHSLSREQLEQYLYDITGDLMDRIVRGLTADLPVQEEDVCMVVDLYKYALVGMILNWLQRGMKEDPTEKIRRLGKLLDGNIRAVLSKTVERR